MDDHCKICLKSNTKWYCKNCTRSLVSHVDQQIARCKKERKEIEEKLSTFSISDSKVNSALSNMRQQELLSSIDNLRKKLAKEQEKLRTETKLVKTWKRMNTYKHNLISDAFSKLDKLQKQQRWYESSACLQLKAKVETTSTSLKSCQKRLISQLCTVFGIRNEEEVEMFGMKIPQSENENGGLKYVVDLKYAHRIMEQVTNFINLSSAYLLVLPPFHFTFRDGQPTVHIGFHRDRPSFQLCNSRSKRLKNIAISTMIDYTIAYLACELGYVVPVEKSMDLHYLMVCIKKACDLRNGSVASNEIADFPQIFKLHLGPLISTLVEKDQSVDDDMLLQLLNEGSRPLLPPTSLKSSEDEWHIV